MEMPSLENNFKNEIGLQNEQKSFIETAIGKTINAGLNIGLRYLLPDFIEEQVIDVKDTLLENGLKEGVKKAVNSIIDLGKSALGIVTGNFENLSQVQTVIKNGGILDTVSDLINSAVEKGVENNQISQNVGNIIRQGKNVIINNISKNLENEFESQLDSIEKLNKYSNNWKEYFSNKDFEGMEKEYQKIKDKLKEIIPLENTIKQARQIENLHILIKNNGKNFDLSNEQLELIDIFK